MEENTIDLRELLIMLQKNLRLIVKITGVFLLVAIMYLLIASPVYESESLLRIKQQQGLAESLLENMPGTSDTTTKQRMNTYAEMIKSRSVIEPVIKATEKKNGKGQYPAYDGFKNRVIIIPVKDTEILKVTVNADTPGKAQEANALLIKTFLNRLTELMRAEKVATKDFIAGRTVQAKKEATDADKALSEYKRVNNIISPDSTVKSLTERVTMVDTEAATIQLDQAQAEAQLSAVNGQLGGEAKDTADSDVIKGYSDKLAQLEMTRIEYLQKYTEVNPKMQEINTQISSVKQKIQDEYAKIAALQAPSTNPAHQGLIASKFQSEAGIVVAKARSNALQSIKEENNSKISQLSKKEQGYVIVERDAQVAQEVYLMLSKRLEEAKVAEVMVPNEVQIVDDATLPTLPIKPKKALTLALAVVLGVMAGCGYAIAKELMNRKMRSEEDISHFLELPTIGVVPDVDSLEKTRRRRAEQLSLWEKIRRFLKHD